MCNLCNATVDFVIRRDSKNAFLFAAQQSEIGQKIMTELGLEAEKMETVAVVEFLENEKPRVWLRSDAALEIARRLGGGWRFFSILKILPRGLRDFFYGLVARNRYRVFGKKDTCRLPTAGERERFLG